jgi:hypothetical protein
MTALLVLAVLGSGCSTQAKCVSSTMKLDEKMEACGVQAARPKDEVEALCADTQIYLSHTREFQEYVLGASNCDAFKLRLEEFTRRDIEKALKEDEVNEHSRRSKAHLHSDEAEPGAGR